MIYFNLRNTSLVFPECHLFSVIEIKQNIQQTSERALVRDRALSGGRVLLVLQLMFIVRGILVNVLSYALSIKKKKIN